MTASKLTLLALAVLPFTADASVGFSYADFTTTAYTAGITSLNSTKSDGATSITVTASVNPADSVLVVNNTGAGLSSHLGVVAAGGPTAGAPDWNTGNANQYSRIGTGQFLTLSFNTDVYINSFSLNNLLAAESALITTSGTAFNGLTGYDTVNGTGQYAGLAGFGYTGSSFALTPNGAATGNDVQTILFGGDEGSSILLLAGQTITFGQSGTTNGGYGLNGFTVSAVPEPSTYGLLGAGAIAAAAFVRRRRKCAV